MSLRQIQCPHSYSFDAETYAALKNKVDEYVAEVKASGNAPHGIWFQPLAENSDYQSRLLKQLEKYDTMLPTFPRLCPKKFKQCMNRESGKIGNMLVKFQSDPRTSYPFYVSKSAFLFALMGSVSEKIAVVATANDKLLFRRFRASLYKDGAIQFKELDDATANYYLPSDRRKSTIAVVNFLRGIMHFVVIDGNAAEMLSTLPFKLDYCLTLTNNDESTEELLAAKASEIILFVRNNKKKQTPPQSKK